MLTDTRASPDRGTRYAAKALAHVLRPPGHEQLSEDNLKKQDLDPIVSRLADAGCE